MSDRESTLEEAEYEFDEQDNRIGKLLGKPGMDVTEKAQ